MKNERIKSNLIHQKNECLKAYESIQERPELFDELCAALETFDFEGYKIKLENEIRQHLNDWWTNPEKGINKEEELYAVLFEYDYFFAKEVDAAAYGIGQWKDYQEQTEPFDMGYEYDFTTQFYAVPGITLNFFDPLERLDNPDLPSAYEDMEVSELEGFSELIQLYKISGILTIHEVFQKMDQQQEFEGLNYKDNFMFIIGEHDSGEFYPILIKERR